MFQTLHSIKMMITCKEEIEIELNHQEPRAMYILKPYLETYPEAKQCWKELVKT
jgi:hypothetical protein